MYSIMRINKNHSSPQFVSVCIERTQSHRYFSQDLWSKFLSFAMSNIFPDLWSTFLPFVMPM